LLKRPTPSIEKSRILKDHVVVRINAAVQCISVEVLCAANSDLRCHGAIKAVGAEIVAVAEKWPIGGCYKPAVPVLSKKRLSIRRKTLIDGIFE